MSSESSPLESAARNSRTIWWVSVMGASFAASEGRMASTPTQWAERAREGAHDGDDEGPTRRAGRSRYAPIDGERRNARGRLPLDHLGTLRPRPLRRDTAPHPSADPALPAVCRPVAALSLRRRVRRTG